MLITFLSYSSNWQEMAALLLLLLLFITVIASWESEELNYMY